MSWSRKIYWQNVTMTKIWQVGESLVGKGRLPCKQEDSCLGPRIYGKSRVMVYIHNPNTRKAETVGSQALLAGQLSLCGEFQRPWL